NFHHAAYDVEVMEEAMNVRRLVAFDNVSVAVLFFNQPTGGLMAGNYVNKEPLLTVMPYQLNEVSPLPVNMAQSMIFDPVHSNQ
ncbi:CAP-associated domain-containing protein, partial [Enterococcus faecalis]